MTADLIHKIIRSKRKTLGLQITKDAMLIVRAPLRASLKDIHEAVRTKLRWIEKKQKWMRENYREREAREFKEGERFLYLGEPYPLVHTEEVEALAFDGKAFLFNPEQLPKAAEIFTDWYHWQALKVITGRVKHYAALHGFTYAKIKLSSAETRWGSCSHDGNLNFNWRLLMAPPEIVDYVVAHELAHLAERNHSRKFWDKVAAIFPAYETCREWLRKNDRSLEAF